MIDNELASPREEFRQGFAAIWAIESIRLADTDPRQAAPLPAEFVAQTREFLFLCEEPLARLDP